MHGRLWMIAVLALAGLQAAAQTVPTPAASAARDLPAVVVSGELPGPGLWKVSKDGHVLWILGTLAPLPKKMAWSARQVTAVELASQAVLRPPGIALHAKLGFFGTLLLLPRLIGIRDDPGGRRLAQVLPPPLYARWQTLKAQYLGRDRGVEKYRPIFAGLKLYQAAIKRAGLDDRDVARKRVEKLARQHDIPLVKTDYVVAIADPKAALKSFRHGSMDDLACFGQMLDRVEYGVPNMQARANAWATGDIDTLARLPRDHAGQACADALSGAAFARQQGLDDLPEKLARSWMAAAVQALAQHRSTLALLPMRDLLAPDGYLARLRAGGYTVESPGAQDASPADAGSAASPAAPASVTR
ncbi:TraB/GumN family protein [Fulvimonas sp. R45]|uniref:TraB/GumN family protein n=1 Tax=Fulvimonas sp. R45 TaxID=3045937 RepID=UPI00265F2905|nr:TraB/GumN family protein [Fulvimonas sp. R45]MDO1529968.1 TraB/GumN family protein [Fulvimonas sp. R45]